MGRLLSAPQSTAAIESCKQQEKQHTKGLGKKLLQAASKTKESTTTAELLVKT